ncbi:MAG TPA: ABC transporter permease [Acidimicrobiales bacterium]
MTVQEQVGTERLVSTLAGPSLATRRLVSFGVNAALYIVAMAIALALASLLIVSATDAAPGDVFHAMYEGSLSRPSAIALTLNQAMPILIVALGAIIASRAGIINIGQEGQVILGGIFGAVIALKIGGPAVIIIPLTLVAALVGGALWAGVAALLRYWRGVDVVISTLLLNFVAVQVLSYALIKPWLLQETRDNVQKLPQSDRIESGLQLPRWGSQAGFSVSSGLVIGLVLAALVTFALARTRWGFQLKMLGFNPNAARSAGVSMVLLGGGALVLSGAFAGLAGGVIFTATAYRIQPGFSNNVGFDGLLVALIARRNAAATVPVAFFFGALRAGGGFLASTGVPRYLVDVVQPLLVLAALLPPVILSIWERRRALRVARQEAARVASPAPVGAMA